MHNAMPVHRTSKHRYLKGSKGGVAQLGERCVRNAEVGSSILLLSTMGFLRPSTVLYDAPALQAFFVSGVSTILYG